MTYTYGFAVRRDSSRTGSASNPAENNVVPLFKMSTACSAAASTGAFVLSLRASFVKRGIAFSKV